MVYTPSAIIVSSLFLHCNFVCQWIFGTETFCSHVCGISLIQCGSVHTPTLKRNLLQIKQDYLKTGKQIKREKQHEHLRTDKIQMVTEETITWAGMQKKVKTSIAYEGVCWCRFSIIQVMVKLEAWKAYYIWEKRSFKENSFISC